MNSSKINPGKIKKGTIKKLLQYVLKFHRIKLFIVLVLMIIGTIANVTAIYNVQNVIQLAVEMVETNSKDFTEVINTILLMVGLYATNIVATYTYMRLMVDISQNTLVNLRDDLFTHMTSLPIKYFDTNKHGDLMSRFTNDTDATRQMISQSIPQIFIATLTLIGYLIAMIITSYVLSIITIVVTLSLLFITKKIAKKSRKFFVEQQKSLGKMNGYIEEMIEGQKVVKVFRHEEQAIKGFDQINQQLYENATKASIRSGMLIPITVNIGYLGFSIISVSGALLVTSGALLVSQLIAYLLFTRNFTGPLNQISQQANFIGLALAGAGRIFDVFDQEKEVDEGNIELVNVEYDENKQLKVTSNKTNNWAWINNETNEITPLKGDVRFENVYFGYSETNMVLKNISLFAKPGQKIAFVGATGAGKTTITNLINRFYDIKEGTITYDGIDIKKIKKDALRKSLGVVLQDTDLFSKTVMENIRYGNLDATDEEVINAAKLANAHEFIMKLPEGYNTLLTDNGSNLSQGQRQLLSIARVTVFNPPVLILDEATSSIDTYTEKLIQEGMDKLMENRTVFVIAHRLSTIKNSKAIIVLDSGEIIERGNHNDLVNLQGRYYQLYTGLFELE